MKTGIEAELVVKEWLQKSEKVENILVDAWNEFKKYYDKKAPEYLRKYLGQYSNSLSMRIPLIPDSRSDLSRTPVPKDDGHLNRSGATLVFSDILPINQVASSFCFFLIDPPFN